MNGPLIRIVLICIAAVTVIAGLVQLVAPAWELRIIATTSRRWRRSSSPPSACS